MKTMRLTSGTNFTYRPNHNVLSKIIIERIFFLRDDVPMRAAAGLDEGG